MPAVAPTTTTMNMRRTLGESIIGMQVLQFGLAFGTCYLVANPEYAPGFIAPYLARVRSLIGSGLLLVFGGRWFVVMGKLILVAMAGWAAYRVVVAQKEQIEVKSEGRREEENRDRMRRARALSQQKLSDLVALHEQAAAQDAIAAVAAAISSKATAISEEEAQQKKEEDARSARSKAQGSVNAASAAHPAASELEALRKQVAQSSKGGAGGAAGGSSSNNKQQFVEGLQMQVDAVSDAADVDDALRKQALQTSGGSQNKGGAGAASGDKNKQRFIDNLQKQVDSASAAAAAAAAAPSSSPSPSSSAAARVGQMIPLSVAQEAEERQRRWMEQIQDQIDGPAKARAEAVEVERRLREEQDEEFTRSLEADERRRVEFEMAKEQAELKASREAMEQAEAKALEETLLESRRQAREALPEEPAIEDNPTSSADGGGGGGASVVVVRVRLPGSGAVHQRRFLASSMVADVAHWTGLQEEVPLRGGWRLVTSFPRTVPDDEMTVGELAGGASAVALFVELG